jgi:predicted acyl esterase
VADRADLDSRGDVACFTTPPFAVSTRLLGEPRLAVVAAADQQGFDLCAALSVLDAEAGRVRQLCTGLVRLRGPDCLEARQRRLSLQPLCATLRAGERLRLSLAGAAWPQIAVNPGDGSLPMGPAGPRHRVIRLTLQLASSRLWLASWVGANCAEPEPVP